MSGAVIDPRVCAAVSTRLGPVFDELVDVMIDLGIPPIFLFGDDRERLAAVTQQAEVLIDAWERESSTEVEGLLELLPRDLRVPSTAQSLLEGATWSRYFDLPESIFQEPNLESRALSATPTLHSRLDKDGLIHVGGLDARSHGLFVDGMALHYHQLLRRNFGSSINTDLIAFLLSCADATTKLRLAVDDRRLRTGHEFRTYEERDYWYGPPLDDALLDDPHFIGEAVHGDPRGGLSLLNAYSAISFRWAHDDDLKTVEVEEMVPLRDADSHDRFVLVRYLHAIRDTTRQAFVHCDGAVKAFERSSYPASVSEFASRGKGAQYKKVFRLDGLIGTDAWSQITAQWFRGNPLVTEYLASLQIPPTPSP